MDGQIESTLRNCTFRPVFPVVFPFHQGQCRHIAVEAWILDDEVVDWGEEPAKRYHFSFFIRDWMMIHDELGWAISWLYHAELCDESWEKKWMSSFFTRHPESLPSMGPYQLLLMDVNGDSCHSRMQKSSKIQKRPNFGNKAVPRSVSEMGLLILDPRPITM